MHASFASSALALLSLCSLVTGTSAAPAAPGSEYGSRDAGHLTKGAAIGPLPLTVYTRLDGHSMDVRVTNVTLDNGSRDAHNNPILDAHPDGKHNVTAEPFLFQIIGSKKFNLPDKLNWTSNEAAEAYGFLQPKSNPSQCLRASNWETSEEEGPFASIPCGYDDDESLFPSLFLLSLEKYGDSGQWGNWYIAFIADLVTKGELWKSLPQYGPVFDNDPKLKIHWSKSTHQPTYFDFPKEHKIDPVPNA